MKNHIKYPKTNQFREILSVLKKHYSYVGEENGETVYDNNLLGSITFTGTVKLHGTNASWCYNDTEGLYFQSKRNVISVKEDNLGFAFFSESRRKVIMELINQVKSTYNIDTSVNTITIYGEFVGKGIQKGVAISNIDKSMFIFGIKVATPQNQLTKSFWLDCKDLRNVENNIHNIYDYETYSITIDLNNPQLKQNELIELTSKVEKECPVAKYFGHEGIGEGIVWTHIDDKKTYHRFKVKGEKHSVTKVKKLASVDVEKLNSINEFVEYSVTENRIDQGITEIFNNNELDIKKLGDFIRWIVNDIHSEELDTLIENKLEPKDVNKHISNKARNMFFEKYNKI